MSLDILEPIFKFFKVISNDRMVVEKFSVLSQGFFAAGGQSLSPAFSYLLIVLGGCNRINNRMILRLLTTVVITRLNENALSRG